MSSSSSEPAEPGEPWAPRALAGGAARGAGGLGGGGRVADDVLLQRTVDVLAQGASGIVYGRNIIQHQNPAGITAALMAVLHDNDAPSGIVAEAAARGVPVLGPARGWAASMVTGTGIGEVAELSAADPAAEIRAALTRLVASRDRRAAAARRARTRLGVEHFVTGLIGDAR